MKNARSICAWAGILAGIPLREERDANEAVFASIIALTLFTGKSE